VKCQIALNKSGGFEGGGIAAVGAAVDAFAAAGGDVAVAVGALDHCVGGSAVGDAVGGVDLFDFFLQLLVGEAGLGSEEIPHGVAGQGEALDSVFEIADAHLGGVGAVGGFGGLLSGAEV
jgi:hypothetical protein